MCSGRSECCLCSYLSSQYHPSSTSYVLRVLSPILSPVPFVPYYAFLACCKGKISTKRRKTEKKQKEEKEDKRKENVV